MIKVELRETEVVLYSKEVGVEGESYSSATVVLTNERLIFQYRKKEKMFKWVDAEDEYPVFDIKMYNGNPQVIQNKNIVEIYLKNKQLKMWFIEKKEAKNFLQQVTDLLTGKSSQERKAQKVKQTIALVDDTLGIDSVQAATGALKGGVLGGVKDLFGKKTAVGKAMGFFTKGAEALGNSISLSRDEQKKITKSQPVETQTDDEIQQLKKYKELLDAGVISQEDFEKKKKKIMGI